MRFIHTADIHLGAEPDKGQPWSERRREEIWDSFRNLIALAGREEADLLLIAGDLFHRQPLRGELREVGALFASIPRTQIVLAAGNHDYLRKESCYRDFSWPENVHFLAGREVERVFLRGIRTYIYGCSYHSREIRGPLYDKCAPGGEPGIHILLAHGGDEKHIPMQFSALLRAGFDYVALGHIHRPRMFAEGKMAYSGALEPIDKNDFGPHGYVSGRIEAGSVRTEFRPFACREYIPLELRVDGETTQFQLEETVREEISRLGKQHIYSLSLVGMRAQDTVFVPERLRRFGNVTDVEDYTEPELDIEGLQRRFGGTIIGEYIGQFPAAPEGVRLKALHYGLQALMKARGQA